MSRVNFMESTGKIIFLHCVRNHVILILTVIMLIISGCRSEIVPEPFLPNYEYEAYQYSLEQANLAGTALGSGWKKAGENALYNPVDISLPYQEEFYLDPVGADAAGYRFFVLRGLRIEIEITIHSADSMQLFADLFRQSGDSTLEWTHIASADKDSLKLKFEPRLDSYYVLRLQPELLRGGRFKVLIRERNLQYLENTRNISMVGHLKGGLAGFLFSDADSGVFFIQTKS